MDKLILVPDADGYQSADGDENIGIKLDGGASRIRKDKIGAAKMVSCKWTLNPGLYQYWRTFYAAATKNGSLPFLCDLLSEDGGGPVEHVCQFVPGSVSLPMQQGLMYVQQAQLEVIPLPRDTALDTAILLLYNAAGAEAEPFLRKLYEYVNKDLPAIMDGIVDTEGHDIFRYDTGFYTSGSYYVYASPWGKKSWFVTPTNYWDEFAIKSLSFPNNVRLTTNWPSDTTPDSVWGYMQLGYGNYDGGITQIPPHPKKIVDISNLRTTFEYDWTRSEYFNILLECYLTQTSHWLDALSDKVFEVGFLLYGDANTIAFHDSGTLIGTYNDPYGTSWTVRGRTGGAGGYYITLMQGGGAILRKGTVDWKALFTWLIAQNISYSGGAIQLTDQLWWNGVAIGSEPTSRPNGSDGTTVVQFKSFSVTYG